MAAAAAGVGAPVVAYQPADCLLVLGYLDGRTLAANFIDDGARIWLIGYEYSGNNDPCFELGNIAAESRLPPDGLAELVGQYYGRPLRHKVARAAVLAARSAGPRRRLVSVCVTGPGRDGRHPVLWGGGLILRDGAAVGQLTSAAWAETLGCAAGLGHLWHPVGEVVTPGFLGSGGYQVNVAGDLYPARVSLRPPFDPDGHQARAADPGQGRGDRGRRAARGNVACPMPPACPELSSPVRRRPRSRVSRGS